MISVGKYTYFLFGSMDCSPGSVHMMAPQTEKSDFYSWPEDLRIYIQCSSLENTGTFWRVDPNCIWNVR